MNNFISNCHNQQPTPESLEKDAGGAWGQCSYCGCYGDFYEEHPRTEKEARDDHEANKADMMYDDGWTFRHNEGRYLPPVS